jgi:hypothetical protein
MVRVDNAHQDREGGDAQAEADKQHEREPRGLRDERTAG